MEATKRPELKAGGMALLPDEPLIFNGLPAPTLDEIDPDEVRSAVQRVFDTELNDDQKAAVIQAGILDTPAKYNDKKRVHSEVSGYGVDNNDDDVVFEWTCNEVRRKIRAFIESGEMKITEFQRAIHVNSNSYGNFMRCSGPWHGLDNSTMSGAYRFFKKREAQGIIIPKKRRTKTSAVDLSGIHLEGEEIDSVPVYDTCDEIRRKISAYLRKPGITQAQLLKEFAAQFKTIDVKLQSKQLNDFRGKSGADSGNTSRVFYGAYVYFEKLRIKEGKPKSKHRMDMERIWAHSNGFDTKRASHNKGFICRKDEIPVMDQYGSISIHHR